MTSLARRKTKLTFETSETVHYKGERREVIIEARPHYAVIHLKNTRQRYEISWEGIYNLAVKVHVERNAQRKRLRRSDA